MSLLPQRLRLPQPSPWASADGTTSPTHATRARGPVGPWLATQQLEPGVQLRLRLRPRGGPGGAEAGAHPGCGWFESSRELRLGLEVCECEALALPAAGLGAGLEVIALA